MEENMKKYGRSIEKYYLYNNKIEKPGFTSLCVSHKKKQLIDYKFTYLKFYINILNEKH